MQKETCLVKGKVLWKENIGRRMKVLAQINYVSVPCVLVNFLFFPSIS